MRRILTVNYFCIALIIVLHYFGAISFAGEVTAKGEIGRASCRERV